MEKRNQGMEKRMKLENYRTVSVKNKFARYCWSSVWGPITFLLPRSLGNSLKIFVLRLFGAKVDRSAKIYSGVKIYQPWKLVVGANSALAPGVDCYNVDWIFIGSNTTVSQNAYLCTASHDIEDGHHRLVTKSICIGDQVWIGARAFINMGVNVGEGSVVAGQSFVNKDVQKWSVVGGNPFKYIKKREIKFYSK